MRGKKPGTKCGNQDANYMAPEHWKHILYIWLTFSARSKLCLNKQFPTIPTKMLLQNLKMAHSSSEEVKGHWSYQCPSPNSAFVHLLGLPATCCSKGRRCESQASSSNQWKFNYPSKDFPWFLGSCISAYFGHVVNKDPFQYWTFWRPCLLCEKLKSSRIKSSTPKLSACPIWNLSTSGTFKLPTPIPPTLPPLHVSPLRAFLGSTSPELRLAETVAVKAPVASRKGLRVAAGGDGRASNVWMVLKGWHFLRLLLEIHAWMAFVKCLNFDWKVS